MSNKGIPIPRPTPSPTFVAVLEDAAVEPPGLVADAVGVDDVLMEDEDELVADAEAEILK
jgi:hypothetical protein